MDYSEEVDYAIPADPIPDAMPEAALASAATPAVIDTKPVTQPAKAADSAVTRDKLSSDKPTGSQKPAVPVSSGASARPAAAPERRRTGPELIGQHLSSPNSRRGERDRRGPVNANPGASGRRRSRSRGRSPRAVRDGFRNALSVHPSVDPRPASGGLMPVTTESNYDTRPPIYTGRSGGSSQQHSSAPSSLAALSYRPASASAPGGSSASSDRGAPAAGTLTTPSAASLAPPGGAGGNNSRAPSPSARAAAAATNRNGPPAPLNAQSRSRASDQRDKHPSSGSGSRDTSRDTRARDDRPASASNTPAQPRASGDNEMKKESALRNDSKARPQSSSSTASGSAHLSQSTTASTAAVLSQSTTASTAAVRSAPRTASSQASGRAGDNDAPTPLSVAPATSLGAASSGAGVTSLPVARSTEATLPVSASTDAPSTFGTAGSTRQASVGESSDSSATALVSAGGASKAEDDRSKDRDEDKAKDPDSRGAARDGAGRDRDRDRDRDRGRDRKRSRDEGPGESKRPASGGGGSKAVKKLSSANATPVGPKRSPEGSPATVAVAPEPASGGAVASEGKQAVNPAPASGTGVNVSCWATFIIINRHLLQLVRPVLAPHLGLAQLSLIPATVMWTATAVRLRLAVGHARDRAIETENETVLVQMQALLLSPRLTRAARRQHPAHRHHLLHPPATHQQQQQQPQRQSSLRVVPAEVNVQKQQRQRMQPAAGSSCSSVPAHRSFLALMLLLRLGP